MARLLLVLTTCVLVCAATVQAERVTLGSTTTGGMMIYYNNIDVSGADGVPDGVVSGYDENTDNQAYVRFQYGYNNTNGTGFEFSQSDLGGFSFDDIFSGPANQFALDLIQYAPTYQSDGGVTLPLMSFYDYVAGGPNIETPVLPSITGGAWAINGYNRENYDGTGTPQNSVLRGTEWSIQIDNYQEVGTQYILDVSGTLVTDGFIHWYHDQPDTDLTSWSLGDILYFSGQLVYDRNYADMGWDEGWNTYGTGMDNGADQKDFYIGSLTVEAEVVPLPPSVAMMALGLVGAGGFGWLRRRRS